MLRKLGLCIGLLGLLVFYTNMAPRTAAVPATAEDQKQEVDLFDDKPAKTIEVGYSRHKASAKESQNVALLAGKSGNALYVDPKRSGEQVVVLLEAGKTYTSTFTIRHSNVVFDCNHATLDGQGNSGVAILITGELGNGHRRQIKNIKIQNCLIKNYGTGVRIENVLRGPGVSNPEDPAIPNWFEHVTSSPERIALRESYRQASPKNIVLSNIRADGIKNHGIYIGPFMKDVLIENVTLADSQTGVHISNGSTGTRVLKSWFLRNGLRSSSPEADPKPYTTYREAIVIDGSSRNVISHNIFQNNYGKAIATYKNCGEATENSKQVLEKMGKTREESSDFNTIANNYFYLSDSFYLKNKNKRFRAIEIASRQDRLALQWMCSDGFYYIEENVNKSQVYGSATERLIVHDKNGKFNFNNLESIDGHNRSVLSGYARDYSKRNLIFNNKFKNFEVGAVTIMDDHNIVQNNYFKKSIPGLIVIGSKYRGLVADPVHGNKSVGNCAGSKKKSPLLYFIGASSKENNNIPPDSCSHEPFKLMKAPNH